MSSADNGAASRAEAARIVHDVLDHGRSLDQALVQRELNNFSERDQAFIRALAYGTLRTHLRNRFYIDALLDKPLKKKDSIIYALLSVGLFALTESHRPDYAVVSATVSASEKLGRKHARGLVNAILRRFLREQEELSARISESPEADTQHPQWLVELLQQDWPEQWRAITEAGNRQAPMWVRVNQQHLSAAEWLDAAAASGINASAPVTEVPEAVLLDSPVAVNELPGFAAGDCSVQDVASQLVAHYLQADKGMRVLDACAAPGGKSAHLLECAPGIELHAVDIAGVRVERIEENLERLGLQAQVICGDALEPDKWWDGEAYDRILLDAPCSATGVIRRHPDIRYLRRDSDIARLAATQSAMLEKLWTLLKPGGLLLYTTCALLRAENEKIIGSFLTAHEDAEEKPLPFAAPVTANSVSIGQQLLPDTFLNDGFYYALLRRLPDKA